MPFGSGVTTPGVRLAGLSTAAVAAVLCALAAIGFGAAPASADSGLWGVGGYTYVNGVVCDAAPSTTVPLVSWALGGSADPAFLTQGIESSAGLDTGAPPVASLGLQSESEVTAGTDGYASTADIAAGAYLISKWGSDPSAARVAEVSSLIGNLSGYQDAANCLSSGQDGLSATEAATMKSQADRYAGPYTVDVTATAASGAVAAAGARAELAATVTSASGVPVPGLAVSFSAPGVTLSALTSTTDAAGVANSTLEQQPGSPVAAQPVLVTASLSASTGLDSVTVNAPVAAGSTLPVPAVYLAPANTYSATVLAPAVPLAAADPTVLTTTSVRAAVPGTSVRASLSLTGMNGHRASVVVSVAGPLPLGTGESCAAISQGQWAAAVASGSAPVTTRLALSVTGDGVTPGPEFTPAAPGCYTTAAQLGTTDETPVVVREPVYGLPAGSVTVLPAEVSIAVAHGGISGAGAIGSVLAVQGSTSKSGTVSVTVYGPLAAVRGSCAGLVWSGAPVSASVALTAFAGDGRYLLASTPVRVPGCYALGAQVTLQLGALGQLQLATSPGPAGTTALLLAPSIVLDAAASWLPMSGQMHASASIYGTFTQPGAVRAQLLWLPAQPLGCQAGDWSKAAVLSTGTAVTVAGDGTYAVVAPAATKVGCYSMVPVLTLSADPALVIAGPPGAPQSLFLAVAGSSGVLDAGHSLGSERGRVIATLAGIGVLLLAALGRTALLAWWTRPGAEVASSDPLLPLDALLLPGRA
jgi:hypothetical protein